MKIVRRLKARLHARADSEHEQAALRIIIVGLLLAYMALFHSAPADSPSSDWSNVVVIGGILTAAVIIFAAICLWPKENVLRRLLGMLADNASATWYMSIAGEYGYSMIGVYLFVTFGNGFRFGRRYLFASQLLSLTGFIYVLKWVPYWQDHRSGGIGLLIALIVLPLYIATLLERIQEARAKAEEANRAKTSFLANMSHEMRTPLNGIVGVVDLLKTTTLSVQQGELVSLMRHSISVLRSLVDDVLDISKIEAGRLTIEVAPFDLHSSINGLVQLLRPHSQSKGLALRAVIDPALEYRLKGDSYHLRQILLNLLGNAIKFTERGEVTLTVGLMRETAQGVTARFEVKDTGIGIAPDARARIFERFVQADQSTTRKYGGTGLGTTIAKQLAELMGGSIGVESTLGQGSTFWVELPLLRDSPAAEADRSEPGIPPRHIGEGITLVIASAGLTQVASALRSMGERYEILTPVTPVGDRIDALIELGIPLRTIVAACNIDQACSVFAIASQRLADHPVALIYVANGELPVVDKARVNSIKGAFALEYATPKLLSNAIHAVTAGVERTTGDVGDLASVLKRERASLKVLVAEDNATNQTLISQLLESAGYQVVLASDGEEALDLYETERPDLAILDFNMPQRTGVEVIQAIRVMEPAGERMPSLILSASVTPETKDRAKRAGADEFIGKPFDAATLIELIDRLAKRAGQARPGTNSNAAVPIAEVSQFSKITRTRAPREWGRTERASRNARVPRADESNTLVDPARLAQLEDIGRDPSFITELIHGFTGDVETILAKTHRRMAADQTDDLPDLMHALKGAAVGLGATKLAALAVELESCADTLSTKELEPKLEAIQRCFEATSIYLKNYIQSNHHAPL